ncbi:MAG: hypothetical protein PHU39_01800 [Candidatus Pacebacteria bacterium]|nr:hypothetical protein [Candidatus Paceibacterota bacterium]MDD4201497.1 hypothetical protein [Candidatus Paceibacterota bacterium]
MKNKIIVTSLLFSFLLFPFLAAIGQIAGAPPGGGIVAGPIGNISTQLTNIANFLLGLITIVSVIGIVISAYMFISSSGEPGKVSSARQIMIYSLVGAVVGAVAWTIVNWAQVGFAVGDPAEIWITSAITNIANFLLGLIAVIGVIGVVVSGYMFVTSGGDTGKVASARQIMIYSLIGVFIGTFASLFVNWARAGFGADIGLASTLMILANWLATFLQAGGVIGVVVSGYMFVTSGGEPGKVSSARNALIYSLVGVFVGTFANLFVGWAQQSFVPNIGLASTLMILANWLFSFLIVAGVIGVVASGYNFLSSAGEPGKVASARSMLIYSLVGVIVGGLGVILINWVIGSFL